jgi:hypothetical protein
VTVGDTFTIPISITDAVDLISWQFDLSFNALLLQANLVSEGPFMSSFGTTLFSPGVIDNGTGLISLVTDAYVDLPPNPFGDGVLANVEFTAISAGTSPLTLSNVFLNFDDSGFIVANGAVCVNPPGATPCAPPAQVPEPSTLVLLAAGLAILTSRRRRNRR